MKFVRQDPRVDNIMIVNFVDWAEICHGRSSRFPIMGGIKLLTQLSAYNCCTLYA